MNVHSVLLDKTKNIKINDFLMTLFLAIVVPNLAMLLSAFYTGAIRPVVNIDYFLPVILFALGYRNIGLIFLFSFFFIDCILFALQFFPFIRLNDLIYLSNFLLTGLSFYKIITGFIFIIIVSKCLTLYQFSHKIAIKPLFFIFLLCSTIGFIFTPIFSTPLVSSQTFYFMTHKNTDFLNLTDDARIVVPAKGIGASKHWFARLETGQQLNNRLLLIVAESWGHPSSSKTQDAVLAQLKSKPDRFEYIEEGHFFVSGATVAGELRELCQLKPRSFNLKTINSELDECLPNRLKKQGYNTYALHGASGGLYDRNAWYKKAGFESITFFDSKSWPRHCYTFNGACDIDLMTEVSNAFNTPNKTFFYWMTLNSHVDYNSRDILNERLDCAVLGVNPNTEGCRNLKLHAQFFDALSVTLDKPEMKGVEVIIVGDHPPPVINLVENMSLFNNSDVAWIHLRVK